MFPQIQLSGAETGLDSDSLRVSCNNAEPLNVKSMDFDLGNLAVFSKIKLFISILGHSQTMLTVVKGGSRIFIKSFEDY